MAPVPDILVKVIVTSEIPVPVRVAALPDTLKSPVETVPVKFRVVLVPLKEREAGLKV